MPEQNTKWNANKPNDPEDDLDQVLNTALAMYATVEAREGLEQRILNSLDSEKSRTYSKSWAFALAAAVAAIIIVIVSWRFGGHARPAVANHPSTPQMPLKFTAAQKTNKIVALNTRPAQPRIAQSFPRSDQYPKLDHFPSPHPMSEQEEILAMYINQDPDHAALVAEARMEAIRQDEAERRAVLTDDRGIGR